MKLDPTTITLFILVLGGGLTAIHHVVDTGFLVGKKVPAWLASALTFVLSFGGGVLGAFQLGVTKPVDLALWGVAATLGIGSIPHAVRKFTMARYPRPGSGAGTTFPKSEAPTKPDLPSSMQMLDDSWTLRRVGGRTLGFTGMVLCVFSALAMTDGTTTGCNPQQAQTAVDVVGKIVEINDQVCTELAAADAEPEWVVIECTIAGAFHADGTPQKVQIRMRRDAWAAQRAASAPGR